ncbi:hypothetical protein LCGC14_0373490 [marine sediment metagenome]|uniref:Uncharacterized protein n=1 Tax=marine sediment metagenome TaxID=412755 RepID=A0A0F9TAE2_9ZZZZ
MSNAGGVQSFNLILTIVVALEMEPDVVWERIREYARG